MSQRAEALRPGDHISHYRVLSLLGSGGMGEVYLAQDTRLDRHVALKILPTAVASDEDRLRRFVREAKAASAFNHQNVAAVYDVGQHEGVGFIAMEHVEGQTAAARIASGPLTAAEIVEIATQTADALDAAHAKGITHRDIKPANLMLTPRGQVKVLDFGLAKVTPPGAADLETVAASAPPTSPGTVMGTVQYMSPEQILGRDVDQRTDIFSLGAALYEMATGQLPFTGTTMNEIMDNVLHAEPRDIARINAEMPAELGRIISKALEKDRERRYQTARDLLVDLRNLHRAPSRPFNQRRVVLMGCAVGAVILAGYAIAQLTVFSPGSGQTIDSIVVLPFSNASGDPDGDYLSDGITESLINKLSQLPGLRVIARTTAFRYKGKEIDLRKIGAELNVRAVLTGRVTQRGGDLTIQADLVDPGTGAQLWGDRYPRKVQDVFTVQDEVVRHIAERLRPRLSGEDQQRLTRRHTENYEAYQLYARGRYEVYKFTAEGIEKGIKLFNQALEVDPAYALAYAGLSETYMVGSGWYMTAREAGPKAKDAALKALALDASLDEAHGALAYVLAMYDWDWAGADREFRRALELNPGSRSTGDNYGNVLSITGRFDEAFAEQKRALRIDPLSVLCNANLGYAFYYARQYDAAIDQFHKSLDLDPNFWLARLGLGSAYEMKGMVKEANTEYQKAGQAGMPDLRAWAARGLSLTGRMDDARKAVDRLKQASPPLPTYDMAIAYWSIGEKRLALEWLAKARDEHFIIIPTIKADPLFDSLRSDPRFVDLLRSMGLAG